MFYYLERLYNLFTSKSHGVLTEDKSPIFKGVKSLLKTNAEESALDFFTNFQKKLKDLACVADSTTNSVIGTSQPKKFSATHWHAIQQILLNDSSLFESFKTKVSSRENKIKSLEDLNSPKNKQPFKSKQTTSNPGQQVAQPQVKQHSAQEDKEIAKLSDEKKKLEKEISNLWLMLKLVIDLATLPSVEITQDYVDQNKLDLDLVITVPAASGAVQPKTYRLHEILALDSLSEFLKLYKASEQAKAVLLNLVIVLQLEHSFTSFGNDVRYPLTVDTKYHIARCLGATEGKELFLELSKAPRLLAYSELLPTYLDAITLTESADTIKAFQKLILAANSCFTFTTEDHESAYFIRRGKLVVNLIQAIGNKDNNVISNLPTDTWLELFTASPYLLLAFAHEGAHNNNPLFTRIIAKIDKNQLLKILSSHLTKPELIRKIVNHPHPHLQKLVKEFTPANIRNLLTLTETAKALHNHKALTETKQLLCYRFCEHLSLSTHAKHSSQAIPLFHPVPIIKSRNSSRNTAQEVNYANNLRARCLEEVFHRPITRFEQELHSHIKKVSQESKLQSPNKQCQYVTKKLHAYFKSLVNNKRFLSKTDLQELLQSNENDIEAKAAALSQKILTKFWLNEVLTKIKKGLKSAYRDNFDYSFDLEGKLTEFLISYYKSLKQTLKSASSPTSEQQREHCIAKLSKLTDDKSWRKAFEYLCNTITFDEFKKILLKTPPEILPLLIRFKKHSHVVKCLAEIADDKLLTLSVNCLQKRPECFAALLQLLPPTRDKAELLTSIEEIMHLQLSYSEKALLKLYGEQFGKLEFTALANLHRKTAYIAEPCNAERQRFAQELARFSSQIQTHIKKKQLDPLKLLDRLTATDVEVNSLILTQLANMEFPRATRKAWNRKLMQLPAEQIKPLLLAGVKLPTQITEAWLDKLKIDSHEKLKQVMTEFEVQIKQRYPLPQNTDDREYSRTLKRQQDALQNVQAAIYPVLYNRNSTVLAHADKLSRVKSFVQWLFFPGKAKLLKDLGTTIDNLIAKDLLIRKVEYNYENFVDVKLAAHQRKGKQYQRLLTLEACNKQGELKKARFLEHKCNGTKGKTIRITLYGTGEQLEKLQTKFTDFSKLATQTKTQQGQESQEEKQPTVTATL